MLFATAFTQNLVPNPSFEDTVQCPPGWTQIEFATGWINPNGYSPDYFNSCVPDTGCCNIYSAWSKAHSPLPSLDIGLINPVEYVDKKRAIYDFVDV